MMDKLLTAPIWCVLANAKIPQAELARAIRRPDGRSLSPATISQILTRDLWPVSIDRAWLEEQMRAFLRSKGIAAADVPELFKPGYVLPETPLRAAPDAQYAPVKTDEVEEKFMERQILSAKARRQFKLFRDPLGCDPDGPEDVFRGPDQAYISEVILDGARNGRLFAIVGESGAGKSTLVDDFKERIARDGLQVRLMQPQFENKSALTARSILEAIVRDLQPGVPLPASNEKLSRLAQDLLSDGIENGVRNCLIFEEAHDLRIETIKELKRFHEKKAGWKRLLSIMLIAQPELITRLEAHGNGGAREVANRLEIVRMLPLDTELEAYVAFRFGRANATAGDVFAPDVWDAVRSRLQTTIKTGQRAERVSLCYPMYVHNLLLQAINTAAELGAAKVDAAIIKGC